MVKLMKVAAAATVVLAGFLATSAGAATVYCPNGAGGALTAPTTGRYVKVTNAADPGECYFQQGNLDSSNNPGNLADYEVAGYELVDKNGSPGTFLIGGYVNDAKSGSWSLATGIWDDFDQLFLGFHFGNGQGNPDSFIVELQEGMLSGEWFFLANAPDKLTGLSNLYLFTKPCEGDDCGGTDIPEPGTLALLGGALLGLTLVRRRRS